MFDAGKVGLDVIIELVKGAVLLDIREFRVEVVVELVEGSVLPDLLKG